jgi:chromate transporter
LIGATSFGGGYAMIPFFQRIISQNHWVSMGDYSKLIAVAQIVPGPFAIDSSAFIGFRVYGFTGALVASLALSLPSFIALVFITRFYMQFKSNNYIQFALSGMRPVVISLLISAVYIIGIEPVMTGAIPGETVLNAFKVLILIIGGLLLQKYTKINTILFLAVFGIAGALLF